LDKRSGTQIRQNSGRKHQQGLLPACSAHKKMGNTQIHRAGKDITFAELDEIYRFLDAGGSRQEVARMLERKFGKEEAKKMIEAIIFYR